MCPNKVTAQVTLDRMKLPHFMKGQGLSCLNLIATVFCCSQIRWIALRVYKLRMGFSVPSIIWVGAEFMQITMQRTRPAWPAKTKPRMTLDCARIAKEIAMMSGLFVESRGQTLLYSWKKKKNKNRKDQNKVDRNAQITSKDMFPKRAAKVIDGTEKPKIPLTFATESRKQSFWISGVCDVINSNCLIYLLNCLSFLSVP